MGPTLIRPVDIEANTELRDFILDSAEHGLTNTLAFREARIAREKEHSQEQCEVASHRLAWAVFWVSVLGVLLSVVTIIKS